MASYHISCPRCSHTHDVPEHHIKDKESRLLKCAQCDHIWRHFKNPLAEFEQKLYIPQSPPPILEPDVRVVGAFKNRDNYKRAVHHYHMDWWLLVIGAIVTVFVLIKEVGTLPNLSWFFVQIQNIYLYITKNVFSSNDTAMKENITLNILTSHLSLQGNQSILKIKGEVINHSKSPQAIPPIAVKLMDKCEAGNGELCLRHAWKHHIDDGPMKPGERRIFETTGNSMQEVLPTTVLLNFE